MQTTNDVRVGLVGKRATAFIAGFRSVPEVRVQAFCDIDPNVCKRVAAQYEIPAQYRDFAELIATDLDVVVVATPMHLHVQQSVTALQAGKHVLSEVTAAVSVEECYQLVEAVRESGRQYMLAENCCYTKENLLVQALAKAGLFGEMYYAEGDYVHDCRHLHHDLDGNPTWRAAWQVGRNGGTYTTHALGPVLEWLGDHVVSVACLGTGRHTEPPTGMDNSVTLLCKTKRGALVNLRNDMQSPRPSGPTTHFSLQGTKGAYQSARRKGEPNLIWLEGRSPDRETWQDLAEYEAEFLPEPWRSLESQAVQAGHGGGDFFVARDFALSILNGTPVSIDVYRALDFTVPGLVSDQSIAQGGIPLPIPNFRDLPSV